MVGCRPLKPNGGGSTPSPSAVRPMMAACKRSRGGVVWLTTLPPWHGVRAVRSGSAKALTWVRIPSVPRKIRYRQGKRFAKPSPSNRGCRFESCVFRSKYNLIWESI